MSINPNYGLLNNVNIDTQRKYFKEMVKLHGVKVKYKYPLKGKGYNLHGELRSNYSDFIEVFCIFDEHIDQRTSKKLG